MIIVCKIHTSINHHPLKIQIVVVTMHHTAKKEEKLIVMVELTIYREIFVTHFQHRQHTREMNFLQEGKILSLDVTIIRYVVTSFQPGEMINHNQDVMTSHLHEEMISHHREGMIFNILLEERSFHHQQHEGELTISHLGTRIDIHLEKGRSLQGEMDIR